MNIVQRVPTRWSKTGWVEFGLEWKIHFRSNFCAMLNSQTHCDKRLRKEISEERKQILTPRPGFTQKHFDKSLVCVFLFGMYWDGWRYQIG